MITDSPEYKGLRSACRLLEIQLADTEVRRWRAERDNASARAQTAKLKLVLAERASQTGESQMPVCPEAAERFFEKLDK